MSPSRRQGAGQRLDDRGPAAGVLQAHPADVPFQVARGEQREQGVLHGFRHPLAEVRAQPRDALDQGRARHQPARADGRRQRLRRRAEVHDHLGVHAVQRGQRPDVVTELAVVVVFHDDRAGLTRPRGQRLPAAHRQAPAQRVLVRRRRVQQPQVTGKLLGHHAVRVHPAGHHLGARPGQHLARGRVAGFLDARLVSRPEQRRGQQRQPAGHAPGDQDVRRADAEGAGPAEVGGELGAQLGQPVRVRPRRRRLASRRTATRGARRPGLSRPPTGSLAAAR